MLIRYTAWLFILVIFYLLFEVYFLAALINSLSTSLQADQIESLECIGRFITGIGTACACLTWLTARYVKDKCYPKKSILFFAIFPFLVGYFGIKLILDEVVERASPEALMFSLIGVAAKEALLEGRDIPIKGWNDESSFLPVENFQIGLLLLPQAVYVNKEIRDVLVESDSVRDQITKRVITNPVVSKKLKDLFSEVDTLVKNIDELHPNFVKVALQQDRRRYKNRFYAALNKKNLNTVVFDRAFEKVAPNEAAQLTKQGLLNLLISQNLRMKGYLIRSEQLPSKMDALTLTEAVVRLIATQEVNKLKSGDYSLIESLGSEGKVGYRLMLIPLFVISVSSVLVMLNIASVIRLELLSWRHWGGNKFTQLSGKILSIVFTPWLVMLVIGAWGYTLPRGATEESLFSSQSSFIFQLMHTGVRIQTYLYPEVIQGLSGLGFSPYFKAPKKINNEKDFLPIFTEINRDSYVVSNEDLADAIKKKYLLTPIAKSVAWTAIVLKNHEELSEDQKLEIRKAFSLYELINLEEPQNKQKYEYAKRWLDSYL